MVACILMHAMASTRGGGGGDGGGGDACIGRRTNVRCPGGEWIATVGMCG
jgi:hypothetical protein